MEDNKIVEMFINRDETSIIVVQSKYGSYSYSIAYRILKNKENSDECVNDTWLKLWNSIPPVTPKNLSVYIAKITRNIAIDQIRKANAEKRGSKTISLVLDELEECIPASSCIDNEIDGMELTNLLNIFLKSLPEKERNTFIARYWFSKSLHEISDETSEKENNIKACLYRTRMKLKKFLENEGVQL